MTIGILYPASGVYPDIGSDFIDGIKACFKKELPGQTPQLVLEGIGYGGAEKEVYQKAEKLLRIDKVDVLVAFVDLRVLQLLEPLVYSLGKLLIVVNAGANYPYNWIAQPNIIYLSLQHAFLCYLSGIQAAAEPPISAAMATSFYDCGYLHTTAMVNGFTEKGGNISFNFVHNQSYNPFDINPLTNFLATNSDTHKLLCIFDEYPAGLFYQHLAQYDQASYLQLLVSPMMLEEKALSHLQTEQSFTIDGYKPWLENDTNNANLEFLEAYKLFAKKEVTIFALLGWETGLLLSNLWTQTEITDGEKMVSNLKQMNLQSPRGPMHLDEDTHYFITPAVKCHVEKGKRSTEIVPLETIKEQWRLFSAKPAEGVSSGWTNTYLCY